MRGNENVVGGFLLVSILLIYIVNRRSHGVRADGVVLLECEDDQRDIHLSSRRQRQMCIRDTSGTAKDSEDTLQFSALTGTAPMIEEYPLEEVEKAYERMINNKARFRVVLKP